MNDSTKSSSSMKFSNNKLTQLDEEIAKLEEDEFQNSLNNKKQDFEE